MVDVFIRCMITRKEVRKVRVFGRSCMNMAGPQNRGC